jgi:hypothetical protein
MASRTTRVSLIIATLIAGLLAGGNIDRVFVAMPAWQQVGASGWAEFSRHADLGNGLVLYPLEAIGGSLCTLAASVSLYFDRTAPRAAAIPPYAAVMFAAGGLVFTVFAAPIMLGISDPGDPAALRRSFEGFWYWGNLRALCQVLAFIALLGTLAVLLRGAKAVPRAGDDAPVG